MAKISFLVAAVGFTFLFTACKKKDRDDNNYKAAIIGKWTYTEAFFTLNGQNIPEEPFTDGEYIRFTATDTVYFGSNEIPVGGVDYSFYKVDGSNLTIANNKAFTVEVHNCHIDALNNSDLTFSFDEQNAAGVKGRLTVKLKK